MSGSLKTLMGAFGTTDFLMPLILGDLTEEDGRKRARGQEGPSISWTVGHLLSSRVYVLNVLTDGRENPYEQQYGNASATDGSDYLTLAELQAEWDSVRAQLGEALINTTEEDLDALAPDGLHAEQLIRDKIVFFAWHEGYHVGVIGALRKAMGYLGPAELIMQQRKKTYGEVETAGE